MTAIDSLTERSESGEALWRIAKQLGCEVTVEVPVAGFKVRDLLNLANGSVVAGVWAQATDVPLRINGNLIARAEFEIVGEKLGVRLTELE